MAGHQLIEGCLAELRRRLPDEVVDELADGLAETWHHHLDTGRSNEDAARAAIAEFGTTEQITAAFVTSAPGRRIARILLATGPLAGICWGTSLIAARVWTWPVPTAAAVLFVLALLGVVAALAAAASSRRSYRRTRLGGLGGLGLLVLDTAMLAGVFLLAPALVWPMAIAVPVSVARIGLTLRTLSPALTR
jgi:hypothetical protein